MKKFINEIIGQEYKQWNKGNLILVNSGTGTGKSTFVMQELYEYCNKNNKRILYLTNRNILREQIKQKTNKNKDTTITVLNYQKIETMILHNVAISNYDYVVMDECHYFFDDATFNIKTDLFFKWILGQNNICKIMMTATAYILKAYLNKHDIKINYQYELPTDYSYIKSIIMFKNYESINSIIEDIPQNEQIILFSSAKKALDISKKYNGAFICSKYNKKYVKYIDEKELNNIINNEKFNNHLLCCTTVLDNGINIKENTPVKHIIIDVLDRDTFIQCLGRKRIAEGEYINLYFYGYNNKRINGFKKKITNSLEKADYLLQYGQEQYVNHKFKNEKFTDTRMIDDVIDDKGNINKIVNECIYTKYKADLIMYNSILSKKYDWITYKSIIATALRIDENDITELEVEEKELSLNEALESIVDKKLFKPEQKELIDFVGLKDKRGRIQKSIKQLNDYFEANKIPYIIISKQIMENHKRNTIWTIEKTLINVN